MPLLVGRFHRPAIAVSTLSHWFRYLYLGAKDRWAVSDVSANYEINIAYKVANAYEQIQRDVHFIFGFHHTKNPCS